MKIHEDYEFEKLSWEEARSRLLPVKPDLVEVIDRLNPDKAFYLYFASYRYGEQILDRGRFRVPLTQKPGSIDLAESTLPSEVKNDLDYGFMPVSIVLKGAVEQVVANVEPERALILRPSGYVLSLWAAMDGVNSFHPKTVWSIYSGVKSLVMLPPIANSQGNKRLKDYFKIKIPKLDSMESQSRVFKALSDHVDFPSIWSSDLVFFPRSWFGMMEDYTWSEFYLYFYKDVWRRTGYWRNKDYIDSLVTNIQKAKNLKPNPVLSDISKYIIGIAMKAMSAFTVAIDDDYAPISGIQLVYQDVFQLKEYAPIMLHLSEPENVKCATRYYSLRYNLFHERSPGSKVYTSILEELRDLKYLIEKEYEGLLDESHVESGSLISALVKSVDLHFFHSDPDSLYGIKSCEQILDIDSFLVQKLQEMEGKGFCSSAQYFRGCCAIVDSHMED